MVYIEVNITYENIHLKAEIVATTFGCTHTHTARHAFVLQTLDGGTNATDPHSNS